MMTVINQYLDIGHKDGPKFVSLRIKHMALRLGQETIDQSVTRGVDCTSPA